MSPSAVVATLMIVLLAVSIGVLIAGIVLARKGTGTLRTVGWWTAIVASLFVLAFGVVTGMGLVTSVSLGQNPFA